MWIVPRSRGQKRLRDAALYQVYAQHDDGFSAGVVAALRQQHSVPPSNPRQASSGRLIQAVRLRLQPRQRSGWYAALAVAMSLIITLWLWPQGTMDHAQPSGLRVVTVSGEAWRSGATTVPLVVGDTLAYGQTVRVERGQLTLSWDDGSAVWVSAGSELAIRKDLGKTIALLAGHIDLAVAKQPRAPLRVAVGDSQLTVLGTRFRVAEHAGGHQLDVHEGLVAVTDASDSVTYHVAAGESLRLTRGHRASKWQVVPDWTSMEMEECSTSM